MANDDLDAQVARKLGWKSVGYFTGCGDEPGTFAEATRADLFGRPPDSHTGAFVPYFSTSIRAAMELVEGLHVVLYNSRCGADGWTCIIYPQNEVAHVRATMVVADTPALAIVQAFLQLPEKGAGE